MADENPLFEEFACNIPWMKPVVNLHEREWNHIQTEHPEVMLEHFANTIANPQAVHQHHTNKSVIFLGDASTSYMEKPLRIAVKLVDKAFVATAWHSNRAFKGQLLWPLKEET